MDDAVNETGPQADEAGSQEKLRDYLKRATTSLRQTRQRLHDLESREQEPIAVVGMACRYPGGVRSPEDLWRLVDSGTDAVGDFPDDRGWHQDSLYDPDPDAHGKSYVTKGAFLYDAPDFDAGFHGMSGREAGATDPQQRVLLEVAWEALERAAIQPESLHGSDTGVFTGVIGQEYGAYADAPELEGFFLTGNTTSVASGRIAYTLGLEGPAVTLDTACSSSLVAIHLAVQSLRRGECALALAGGATVMASPRVFVEFSRQRGLAPDGRCKSFAAAADGTGWGEGAGLLVLERLSDAVRGGRRILAVIPGSAVNQDGASNGLTAPNGLAQQRVIRQALRAARLSPVDVDAVEAHGTGTSLGDPIEAQALIAAYGQNRPADRPLRLGSIKSNIGHTQAAAGIAGVIKMVMALRHQQLPATLHVDEPSPHVDWTAGAVTLLRRPEAWPAGDRPRSAGVSSFGISGTNAHLIVQEPPAPTAAAPAGSTPAGSTPADSAPADSAPAAAVLPADGLPLLVSARSEPALRAQAAQLHAFLTADPEPDPVAVAHALALTRSHHPVRAAVTAPDRGPLLEALDALARGESAAGLLAPNGRRGRLAFLFTGQGAQRPGMGRELYDRYPAFRAAFEEICGHLDQPLKDIVFAAEGTADAALLDRTEHTQSALFAVEVALHRLLESWGLVPDHVIGHSIGELAAAHVAGVLSVEDACTLVRARGRLMQAARPGGAMTAVQATEDEVAPLVAEHPAEVAIAAVNGPRAVVVSGDEAAVERIAAHFAGLGRKTRRLTVSHAFHSPHMDEVLADFHRVAEGLEYHAPRIPVISNLTGRPAGEELRSADYWTEHIRRPVRFHDGVRQLRELGVTAYLEIGPDRTLTAMAEQCLADDGDGDGTDGEAVFIAPLRRGHSEPRSVLAAAAEAHLLGRDLDWSAVLGGAPAPELDLPTYPFQRRRFWLDSAGAGDAGALGQSPVGHPLLDAAVQLPDGGQLFTARLTLAGQPWLADHRVAGTVLLPGTGFLELALEAAARCGLAGVEELTLHSPLPLTGHDAVQLRLQVAPEGEDGARALTVHSRPEATAPDGEWTHHATGSLTGEDGGPQSPLPAQWPPADAAAVPVDGLYEDLDGLGLGYGPVFQGLRAVWRSGTDLLAEVALPEGTAGAPYRLHPALLDAALHALLFSGPDGRVELDRVRLPFSWSGITLRATGADVLRVRLSPRADGGGTFALDLYDHDGDPVGTVAALTLRALDPAALAAAPARREPLYRLGWTQLPGSATDPVPAAPVVTGASALAALAEAVRSGADAPELVVLDTAAADTTGAGPTAAADGAESVPARTHRAAGELLTVLQEFLGDSALEGSRLVVATRRAVTALPEDPAVDPTGAALWGLARVAQSENPGRVLLADHDGREPVGTALPAAFAGGENQLALRAGARYVPRLAAEPDTPVHLPADPGTPWRLEVTEGGTLDGLTAVADTAPAEPLGPGQVRIAVRAAGMNFRDVLVALGMYPGRASIGGEAAGVVTATGPGVTGLRVGDRVMGLFDGAIASGAVTDQRLLARVPAGWSFAQAATTPVVFLTAYYGLRDLADLRPGERLLVHSAAGGVGLAALQLARHWQAEVFGTASPGKWHALRELGLDDDHLASSRTLDFEPHFAAATDGAGVDVVLDSLAREFVDASLRLLPRGGRFLEMGKTDIRDAGQVAEAHPGVAYRAFDMTEAGPDRIQEMLRDLLELFERGVLTPLPVTAFDVRHAPEAFRHLQQARHIGKVALTVPQPIDPDGTVLVTGGTGALGALAARHLVTGHGARHLVLAGRSGPAAPGAAELAAELTALGATVTLAACDAADPAALADLLAAVPAAHPLTAVVHCAGTLDDATLPALTADRLSTVLRPKVDAAWNLHHRTAGLDLAAFVLYSSVAGVLGNPGQANYAAGNTFLDALAEHRHALGLPAVSLAWGLWDPSAGLAGTLDGQERKRIERSGLLPLDAATGTELFDRALAAGRPTLVPALLDLPVLRRMAADSAPLPAVLGPVLGPARPRASAPAAGASQLARKVAGLDDTDATGVLLDLMHRQIAAVLGNDPSEPVDPAQPFKDLGFDSLTAVELRNVLGRASGLRLPATLLFDYPTPAELAAELLSRLRGAPQPASGPAPAGPAAATDDPIAIVGMGCRFPGGADSPEGLWRVAADGIDTIADYPGGRGWNLDELYEPEPGKAGRTYVRQGGFLHDAAGFDADFFGISPREAEAMDPQQRLLLEVAWETLEHAGIRPGTLRGSQVGVFAGVAAQEYGAGSATTQEAVAGYVLTGSTTSVASGRIAYTLGLEGPAVTVDTACSSSLVAAHLAAQSLRSGECTMALAGGTTIMATPGIFLEFSRQRGMAPDGRCKPFAGAADGTGWGEGVGMVLLERLSDARANGHEVLAVIRGSAVNQDGASNGLTAPNGPSQQRVIRAALASAGLTAADVDAVEAHGTGTVLGDPIEAQALLATYGQDRPADRPLLLGSIKSNIGHTQAAAGIAGIIKTVQALRHGELPRTLHIDEPSPHVNWSDGAVRLLSENTPWPETGRPRRAGVSSFGISGTNAHIILEAAPAPSAAAPPQPGAADDAPAVLPLVLSARDAAALREQAAGVVELLAADSAPAPADLGFSLVTTRDQHPHRAVVVGADPAELREGLSALARGEQAPGLVEGVAGAPGKVAFVFPGQGAQWEGMARELMETSPVFRESIRACAEALGRHTDWSLPDVLLGRPGAPPLERVDVVQPALFAVMVSLARLWQAAGVRPDAVVGHSQGEIAAAHIAGALDLDDAARVVALRSRALTELAGTGAMASIPLPADEVTARLADFGGDLTVAVCNGPAATVVAGAPQDVERFVQRCRDEDVRARTIPVDYASHTPHVEVIRERLLAELDGLSPRAAGIPLYSTLTGEPLDTTRMTADYWYENLRRPVRFDRAVAALAAAQFRSFVETSPHPVLTVATEGILDGTGTVIPTLRRDDGGLRRFLTSLAGAHTAGVAVAWERSFEAARPRRIELPSYPFQHRSYWLRPQTRGSAAGVGLAATGHPLLGSGTTLPGGARLLTARVSTADHPWLADHAVHETVLLPGTAFVDLALHAAAQSDCDTVEELTLHAPVVLPERGAVLLQAMVGEPDPDGRRSFTLHSRPAEEEPDGEWVRHATGVLARSEAPVPAESGGAWPPPGATPVDLSAFYPTLADTGLAYGPAFQGVQAVWRDDAGVYAEVAVEEGLSVSGFVLHPALLDAALHPATVRSEGPGEVRLPFAWSGVRAWAAEPRQLRVRLTATGPETVALRLADGHGAPVAEIGELALRPVSAEVLGTLRAGSGQPLLRLEWASAPAATSRPVSGPWQVAGDPALTAALLAAGVDATDCTPAPAADGTPAERAHALLVWALAVVQEFLADPQAAESRLVLATREAVAAAVGERPDPAAATLWGLLRSAQSENPDRLVLLDLDDDPRSLRAAPAALATGEPQLALRAGTVTVPRLAAEPATAAGRPAFPADGTVLVTGGTGVLGGVLARHLVGAYGVRHLLLTSRQGRAAAGAAQLVAELTELGAEVTVEPCDTTDRAALAALLGAIAPDRPLSAVFHAAGVLRDATIPSLTPEHLADVLRPKADAAWHLHELTADLPLTAFVLYSSAAGVLGAPGQGNYAAANAFLDALAEHRHALGLPAASIAWGLWAEAGGLTGDVETARVERGGLSAMTTPAALELLDAALAGPLPAPAAARLNLPVLRRRATDGTLPPVLRGLVRAPARRAGAVDSAALRARLAALEAGEQQKLLLDTVRTTMAAVLGHSEPDAIAPDRSFLELGFDSLTGVEFRNRLATATGLRLPAALVFDRPNAAAVAEYLLRTLVDAADPAERVLTDLERLEAALLALPERDRERGRVTARLQRLLDRWHGTADDPVQAVADRIGDASVDEVFDFIDRELGRATT
ncbi:type I polyketide synthase [Streptomyces sp. NRRL S-350]|uniref:type I polyketide synthase n=1 Tax=Streptomyces sp. NRRL S-350 TaxID=1463902 RepID=UPI0007C452B5|nr:type I polyketide synthase [Streptomyces sp. NRRL S-350]